MNTFAANVEKLTEFARRSYSGPIFTHGTGSGEFAKLVIFRNDTSIAHCSLHMSNSPSEDFIRVIADSLKTGGDNFAMETHYFHSGVVMKSRAVGSFRVWRLREDLRDSNAPSAVRRRAQEAAGTVAVWDGWTEQENYSYLQPLCKQ